MPSIYEAELQGVLLEQRSFGVTDIEMITSASSSDASARAKLPEGDIKVIKLSNRGFQVRSYCLWPLYSLCIDALQKAADDGTIFEAIEGLLQSLSPIYALNWNDALSKKLQALLHQNWDNLITSLILLHMQNTRLIP